jgi:hypothetical protein
MRARGSAYLIIAAAQVTASSVTSRLMAVGVMMTCHVRYEIGLGAGRGARAVRARRWMELVAEHGGVHRGYFLAAQAST